MSATLPGPAPNPDASAGPAAPDHGGSLADARSRFPDAPGPLIDLSTGINPQPYPFTPPDAAAFARLPEPAALAALQAAAARAYGAPGPDWVVAAPGTQVLIGLLPLLFPQDAVQVVGPTYAEHARAWALAGAAVRTVAATVPGMAAVLCNPNNPDGARYPAEVLLRLSATLPLLVVDEAFADFEPAGLSLAPHLTRPGLIVLRSFGKAFGLAGLRLGFALAEPRTASRIRAALGPWAVSGPALQIGTEALADTAWQATTAARLARAARRLDALLHGAGCRVVGGTSLFRLVEAAPGRFAQLGRAGIYVRAFADRPGLLRFGIPAADQWDRLAAALAGSG